MTDMSQLPRWVISRKVLITRRRLTVEMTAERQAPRLEEIIAQRSPVQASAVRSTRSSSLNRRGQHISSRPAAPAGQKARDTKPRRSPRLTASPSRMAISMRHDVPTRGEK